MTKLDVVLIFFTAVIFIADIILALCLRYILPWYLTQNGYYSANGEVVPFYEIAHSCPCLHGVFPQGSRRSFTLIPISDLIETDDNATVVQRSVYDILTRTLEDYPFLVSLSIPAYKDEPRQKIFACNGIIQSERWVLTTKICVKEKSEWYRMTVRSESLLWSKLGEEHSVVQVLQDDNPNLVWLEVVPEFSSNVKPFFPIKFPLEENWTFAISLGWDDQMYNKELSFRHKYKMFDVEHWTSKSSGIERNVCFNAWDCKEISSKALLTSCRHLLGFKSLTTDTCSEFSGLKSRGKKKELLTEQTCSPIYEDDLVSKKTEVCSMNIL